MSCTAATSNQFDLVLLQVEELERGREELHLALQEARLSLVSARFALEQRYATLSVESVPEEFQASRGVSVLSGAERNPTVMKAVLLMNNGSTSSKSEREGSAKDPSPSGLSADSESKMSKEDPLFWFSGAPPSELRQAQAAFRRVLDLAVATSLLEQRALKAASLYASMKQPAENSKS
jgi:hypothetical protein